MKTTRFDNISAITRLAQSLKSIGKVILLSRHAHIPRVTGQRPIIILGNGPSLSQSIADHIDILRDNDLMAVNFMANTDEFTLLKPRYYMLADPHFFTRTDDPNVSRLIDNLSTVDWAMTLFVPFGAKLTDRLSLSTNLNVIRYNAIGAEGWQWLTNFIYKSGRAMPRPRNVMIPSIMVAMQMGYKKIIIIGADHTWTQTLSVDADNHVVSVQPHFYKEDEHEQKRISKEYIDYPLHYILDCQRIAFMGYHAVERFARHVGVTVINSTPTSMIDAFDRQPLDHAVK